MRLDEGRELRRGNQRRGGNPVNDGPTSSRIDVGIQRPVKSLVEVQFDQSFRILDRDPKMATRIDERSVCLLD